MGHLSHLSFPTDLAHPLAHPRDTYGLVRVDTGVQTGDDVEVFYDPMIAKLIVHGRDRNDALRMMRRALEQTQIVGPKTNVEFLQRLCQHPAFVTADDLETGFIARYKAELLPPAPAPAPATFASAALFLALREHAAAAIAAPTGMFASPAFAAFRLSTAQPAARTFSLRARHIASEGAQEEALAPTAVRVTPIVGAQGTFRVDVLGASGEVLSAFPRVAAALSHEGTELLTAGLVAGAEASSDTPLPAPRQRTTIVARTPSASTLGATLRLDVFAEDRQVEVEVVAPKWLDELKGATAVAKGSVTSPMPSKVSRCTARLSQESFTDRPLALRRSSRYASR